MSDELNEKKENLAKDENEESEVKEETLEENVTEKKEKKKFKIKYLIIIAILIAIILGIILAFYLGLININNKIGNSIGNIRNYGYATAQGNDIYYVAPETNGERISIYKCKKNGTKIETLLSENWEIYGLNVVGNYLYFISINDPENVYTDEDYADNKIYKMKTDGSELQVINDNEFSNESYEIYVINDKIYYIGEDLNIYSMDLNGENKNVINDDATGFIGISEDYILLNKEETVEDETKIVTYSMKLDGSDKKAITGERLYSVNIINDDIYYVNSDKQVYKVNLKTGENTFISETSAYNMNVSGNYIYFMNYTDDTQVKIGIYKMKIDGTEETLISELDSYSNFLDVVLGNKIVYMDSNETEGVVNLIDTKSLKKSNLYTYKFETEESHEVLDDVSNTSDSTN